MGNSPNLLETALAAGKTWSEFLTTAIADGTHNDLVGTTKVDQNTGTVKRVPFGQVNQHLMNLLDDAVKLAYQHSEGIFVVTSFGAVGDGVTDDTTAIQAAIDAAEAAGGGIVFFPVPSSEYLTTTSLAIDTAGVSLVGCGSTTVIENTTLNGAIINVAADQVTIRDLKIVGSTTAGSGQNCIRITGIRADLMFERVHMHDCQGYALRCENSSDPDINKVTNCTIRDCVADNSGRGVCFVITNSSDITIHNLRTTYSTQNMIIGLSLDRNMSDVKVYGGDIKAYSFGVAVNAARDILLDGVTAHDIADSSLGEGFHIENAEDWQQTRRVELLNCTARDCAKFGFSVQGTAIGATTHLASAFVTLRGCQSYSNDVDGILIQDSLDASVIDCDSFENDGHGLSVIGNGNGIDPERLHVRGGRYYNNDQGAGTKYGIQLGSGVVSGMVESVECFDNQGTATQDYGLYNNSSGVDIVQPKGSGNVSGLLLLGTRPRSLAIRYDFQTTDASNYDLIFCNLDTDQEGCVATLDAMARRNTGNNFYGYGIKVQMQRTSGTVSSTGTRATDTGVSNGTGSTLANSIQISGDNCILRSVGNASETWDWTVTMKVQSA